MFTNRFSVATICVSQLRSRLVVEFTLAMFAAKVKRFPVLGGGQSGLWIDGHAANGIGSWFFGFHLVFTTKLIVDQCLDNWAAFDCSLARTVFDKC